MLYKITFLIICLLNLNPLISQELSDTDVLNVDGTHVKLDKANGANAILLVNQLIKDKSGEKEKFDAIFLWVAKNIKYNMSSFYTASDAGPHEIAKILKTRSTICLGYAQLMDSLCQLAGITNVTVFGYAKDRFYDIGDSIYGHNHAWNAVKLDGLWYVYDVTWSNGVTAFKYTKKAKFILKLLKKFPVKYRNKKIRMAFTRKEKNMCQDKVEQVYYIPQQRFFNRLIRKWLLRIPIKVYEEYEKGINKNFYLSNPAVFASTHVPDDPMWSLLGRTKCKEFEQDSLFYYLTDSIYKHQERQGQECLECDRFYESSFERRLETLNQNSLLFNPNNRFITTYCNEELGKKKFFGSLNSDNNKLNLADSAVQFYQNALNNTLISRQNIDEYFKYQKNKNDTKTKLLLTDNNNHTRFIKSKVKVGIHYIKIFNQMLHKSKPIASVYYNNLDKYERVKTNFDLKKTKPYSIQKIKELENIQDKKTKQLTALIPKINQQQSAFDSIISHLALNTWPWALRHDSILKPFEKCIQQRTFLLDNYKKTIVDIRKNIYPIENSYKNEIDNILYNPSSVCLGLFDSIYNEVKFKQELLKDLLKIKSELVKAQTLPVNELEKFKEDAIQQTIWDICWLYSNYGKIYTTLEGMMQLREKQKTVLTVISLENETERIRKSIIDKSIKKGYKATKPKLANDAKLLKKKYKKIINYRDELKSPENFNQKKYEKAVNNFIRLLLKV